MYGLDINFLNDREIRPVDVRPTRSAAAPVGDRRPLWFGLAATLAFLALMGGYWLVQRNQVNQLRARSAELDAELAQLQSQLAEVGGIQAQIELVRAENQALVSVFDDNLPWSALLQDLRDRTPARVQMTDVAQTAGETPPDQPDAVPPGGIDITGVACSFDDINDFVLVLKQSPLLQANSVSITEAQKQTTLLDPQEQGSCPGTPAGEPQFLVDYSISANLTSAPASQLLDTLESKGSVGLVTRLRALQETGAIEQ